MHSYILTGIRIGPLMRLLRENGFTPSPKNLSRLAFVFQNAIWSSVLTRREKKVYGRELENLPVPDNPVIIIGHWRTGSTFLHQLLSCDDRFISPTLFQCSFPECSQSAEPYYRPVMGRMVKTRPIDNMPQGFDDAQEDEFAWVKLTPDSPFLKIVFPDSGGYFLNDPINFIPAADTRNIWIEQMQKFSAKICRNKDNILLLKNPFHSLRIPFLREVFPNARFVHLHRHPYHVVASSVNLWRIMAKDNQLRGKPVFPGTAEVAEGLKKIYSTIKNELEKLPPGTHYEISYESLTREPLEEAGKLYNGLGLEFSAQVSGKMNMHLDKVKDFRKNSYTFDDSQKELVYQILKEEFEFYHYPV